jgi:hypothetical protein
LVFYSAKVPIFWAKKKTLKQGKKDKKSYFLKLYEKRDNAVP